MRVQLGSSCFFTLFFISYVVISLFSDQTVAFGSERTDSPRIRVHVNCSGGLHCRELNPDATVQDLSDSLMEELPRVCSQDHIDYYYLANDIGDFDDPEMPLSETGFTPSGGSLSASMQRCPCLRLSQHPVPSDIGDWIRRLDEGAGASVDDNLLKTLAEELALFLMEKTPEPSSSARSNLHYFIRRLALLLTVFEEDPAVDPREPLYSDLFQSCARELHDGFKLSLVGCINCERNRAILSDILQQYQDLFLQEMQRDHCCEIPLQQLAPGLNSDRDDKSRQLLVRLRSLSIFLKLCDMNHSDLLSEVLTEEDARSISSVLWSEYEDFYHAEADDSPDSDPILSHPFIQFYKKMIRLLRGDAEGTDQQDPAAPGEAALPL
ncbi:MAG: hypothetical protein H6618_04620 [Deltaproteobacteria bacterium]|nr:hypothetical protein [Deltaproteobacteria bacterium]